MHKIGHGAAVLGLAFLMGCQTGGEVQADEGMPEMSPEQLGEMMAQLAAPGEAAERSGASEPNDGQRLARGGDRTRDHRRGCLPTEERGGQHHSGASGGGAFEPVASRDHHRAIPLDMIVQSLPEGMWGMARWADPQSLPVH